MANFDFISDNAFRQSLQSDMKELQLSMEVGAHKAAHVLAGSIIEAVLIDYLVDAEYKHPKGKETLRLDLNEAIDACRTMGAISPTSADLCSVVRDYRNLIHPGRAVRTGVEVDQKTATVAQTLIDIVLRDVARLREQKFGYTAEQILTKIERDASAASILGDLLKRTPPKEVKRLVLKAIPDRYVELDMEPGPYEEELAQLSRGYRAVLAASSKAIRVAAAKEFVRVLREEGGGEIGMYKAALFRASDLAWLAPADRNVAKRHLLDEFDRAPTDELMTGLTGVAQFLTREEAVALTDAAMKYAQMHNFEPHRRRVGEFVNGLWTEAAEPVDTAIQTRVNAWVSLFVELKNSIYANWAGALAGVARKVPDATAETIDVDDIPF